MIARALALAVSARALALAVSLTTAACAHAPSAPTLSETGAAADDAASVASIAAFLDAWHAAAARADADAYFGRIAEGGAFLGTDPGERWDRAAFQAAYGAHFARGKAWTFEPFERHVTVAADGLTAWVHERLHSATYGELRGVAVLVRAPDVGLGPWQVALYDLTIPVPNDLADEVVGRIRARAPAPTP